MYKLDEDGMKNSKERCLKNSNTRGKAQIKRK
jgi:hypothetical protein